MRPALRATLVAVALAALPSQADAAPPVFQFLAGFDGWYRIGAFTPIVVEATSTDTPFDGVIVIEAGGATYRQALSLPAPSRKRLEFYVRISEQATLAIRTIDGRGVLTHQELAIRSVLPGERLVVTIEGASAESTAGRQAVVRAADLPRSWRGYDGVTDVIDGGARLDGSQTTALARWRARPREPVDERPLRGALNDAGALDPTGVARWRFLGGYLLVTLGVLCVAPLVTRKASLAAAAVVACGALFGLLAPRYAQLQFPGNAPLLATVFHPANEGAPVFFNTVARVDSITRGWITVNATADTLLRPLAEVPHRISFTEDGRMSLELPMVVGESLTVAALGFRAAGHDCRAGAGECRVPAASVGIETPSAATVLDLTPADEPW